MNFVRRLWKIPRSAPRGLERHRPPSTHTSGLFEEERIPDYDATLYYPVRKGEVFKDHYQVLGKLGYGATSTVWFCRDLHKHAYVVLKVNIRNPINDALPDREVKFYEAFRDDASNHAGRHHVRALLDTFDVRGPHGRHSCLIHEPLTFNFGWFQKELPDHVLPLMLWKQTLQYLLQALDYLHFQLNFIHTDIKASNIMLTMSTDDAVLKQYAEEALDNPILYRDDSCRAIYKSQSFSNTKDIGLPVLIDFGEARHGRQAYRHPVQPNLYRAPEVLLEMDWDHKIDIWNVGVLSLHLLHGKPLFTAEDADGNLSFEHHLAQLSACLGNPSSAFLKRSPISSAYFDETGKWTRGFPLLHKKLEDLETTIESDSQKDFLRFMRRMLQWDPEARPSANELLEDPWLAEEM